MEALPFRSILHPTDYSDSSIAAFAHALRLSVAARSALHLLHVDHAGEETRWERFPDALSLLERWKMLGAGSKLADLQDRLGVELTRDALGSDDVAGTISAFAEQRACDLLVLLTHGSSWMGRILKGSVAEASARLTHAPAMFLHEGQRGFVDPESGKVRLHRILMPVAADVPPMHAWGLAAKVVRALEPLAEFHMLHVGDTLPTFGNMLPYVDLKRGPVVETILSVAGQMKPDLIVMATAGHHDLFDDLRGSTTERVMRQAPCPVLAIPEPARRNRA
ncbi:MAG: universal stress protein [Methylocystis sp.]|uniref:universal stress protein n=1 Tax=Methylocystis sp. TaxID=1911079 RepID=UPI003DA550BB